MKELFIAFVIALVVGSVWNQMNGADPSHPAGGAEGQTGTVDGGSQNSAQSGTGSGVVAVNPEAQAGQELVVDIDEGSFQGYVLDSREPVLVEFVTKSCPYCKTMAPVMGQLAYSGQGVMRVCKVDAEKSPSLAQRYNIDGVPAFVLFSDGHMLDVTSGPQSVEFMRSWLSQNNVSVPSSVSSGGTQM